MLLRSSSTPILGSLLSSSSAPYFHESPNNSHHHHHHHPLEKASSSPFPFGIHQNPAFQSFSCHFSPLSDSSDRDPSALGFRRARSDGNLQSLLPEDSPHGGRRPNPILDTIPSFSVYNSKGFEVDEEEQEIEEEEEEDGFQMPDTMGKDIREEFSFLGKGQNLSLDENGSDTGEVGKNKATPLFLARGLGIDRLGSGLMNAGGNDGGGGGSCFVQNGNEGERSDIENYYRRMVEENPSNALFLRNYAQFLYQSKGDPQRAEEYYSRAILAEPGDGEILSQYAKLVWELHHDKERASTYFEQAVQAAPSDSHVLAAYAGFLWEAEEDDVEASGQDEQSHFFGSPFHHGALAFAST